MSDPAIPRPAPAEPVRGYVFAGGAYLIWGLVLPVFLKALSGVDALEVVAHRILWAWPFALLLLLRLSGRHALRPYLNARTLAVAALCAAIISVNWGVYVYAIAAGHGVDAALGYYINPLLSLALGAIFLKERPSGLQLVAIALACVGVVFLTVATGGLPWVSLMLALSFGLYGLLRKVTPYGAVEGFFLEVTILFAPALALALWVGSRGTAHFANDGWETLLLVLSGPLTAIPLILFAAGARLLRLSTIGMLQYLTPTLLGLTAVFVFGEPFGLEQLVAFAFIWTALAIYTASLLGERGRRRAGKVKDAR
ncbi:EamA family transporter RarD [Aureimonas populi]|uniref:EamA family transporter RarD n=1 Tax=Aureimonas populi TaxID=1701758 RepID=A0ABW5CKD5_9HYPH|nr:EamA family transporter RarD [Aureimonas populi]